MIQATITRLIEIENAIKGLQAEREIVMFNLAKLLEQQKMAEINNLKQQLTEANKNK